MDASWGESSDSKRMRVQWGFSQGQSTGIYRPTLLHDLIIADCSLSGPKSDPISTGTDAVAAAGPAR